MVFWKQRTVIKLPPVIAKFYRNACSFMSFLSSDSKGFSFLLEIGTRFSNVNSIF